MRLRITALSYAYKKIVATGNLATKTGRCVLNDFGNKGQKIKCIKRFW